MSMRLRALELRVVTKAGLFGVHLPFNDGLVVLRADNSMGKSTCVQSILYALGLEGMLSASHAVPLPHVMTQYVQDEANTRHHVLESSVLLEIENGDGKALTMQRAVVSETEDRKLIKTWRGPKLSNSRGNYIRKDRYVRVEGAASREDGFHHDLVRFLDWELPLVERYQKQPCPLYLEAVFPLLVIEQKHGWSGIQARVPTHYGIREVGKRATEFVLKLEEHETVLARQQLEREMNVLKSEWTTALADLRRAARAAGGVIRNAQKEPTADWSTAVEPEVLVVDGEQFLLLAGALARDIAELNRLNSEKIPKVEEVATELAEELRRTQDMLANVEAAAAYMLEDLDREREQFRSIESRLAALAEDLSKNNDIVRLRGMGSTVSLAYRSGECPTCHRPVSDSLLPNGPEPMSVEDNIALIKEQIGTFEAMHRDAERVVELKQARLTAVRERLDELRRKIRSQKRALTADGKTPSEAAVRARIEAEERINVRRHLLETVETINAQFETMSSTWRNLLARKKHISNHVLSNSDEQKIKALEDLFVAQLVEYEFCSIAPKEVRISRTSYRPEHEGFDLGFDLSASDMIRTVWAYVHGLLELARIEETNHPGLVILDEPRQQSTSKVSFSAFVKRASTAGKAGQQILFATSEDEQVLKEALNGLPHQYLAYKGRILKRFEEAEASE